MFYKPYFIKTGLHSRISRNYTKLYNVINDFIFPKKGRLFWYRYSITQAYTADKKKFENVLMGQTVREKKRRNSLQIS